MYWVRWWGVAVMRFLERKAKGWLEKKANSAVSNSGSK